MTQMTEVKTAELKGGALDWAVKRAIGAVDEPGHIVTFPEGFHIPWMMGVYAPSSNWDQCGPLIAKYRPDLQTTTTGEIVAYLNNDVNDPGPLIEGRGKDYLIAACRVVVQFELGDTVQVPQELLS